MTIHSVGVLLSTYNGEKFLEEQIKSVLNQKDVDVTLYIRDDGSTDSTVSILKKYNDNPKCIIFFESNVGVSNSFLKLLKKTGRHEYYAFCDQDDVWDEDKLIVAITHIKNREGIPALYFSTTRTVNQELRIIEEKSIRIENGVYDTVRVLVGNNCTGCTMAFNECLKDMVVKYQPTRIIMHDHWVYALCVAMDGYVYFDKIPHISYRQHGNNELGDKISLKKRLFNSSVKNGRRIRSNIAYQIYENYKSALTKHNKKVLYAFAYYRSKGKKELLSIILKSNLSVSRKIITLIEILIGVF